MTELNIGSTLQSGKYEILRVLGQGGFGITYLARHSLLNETFAIKEFFPKDYCNRDGATSHITVATETNIGLVEKLRERFVTEARNMLKLSHPGIIRIHDIFEENGTAYYVMDFIEGTSLEDMVRMNGPMPEKTGVEYARRIGEALDYVHQHKMTHFDVKPANVMIRKRDGEPILIDFGLSKQYNDSGHAVSTLLMGVSHGYSPLEQYMQDGVDVFSPQTDVYALGATLYYLLTSWVPPEALKLTTVPIEVPVNISRQTADAIKWAMALHRENRCPSARAFIDALDPTKGATQFVNHASTIAATANPATSLVGVPNGGGNRNSGGGGNRNSNGGGNRNTGHAYRHAPAPQQKSNLGKILGIGASVVVVILIAIIVVLWPEDKSGSNNPYAISEMPAGDSVVSVAGTEGEAEAVAAPEETVVAEEKSAFSGICGYVADYGIESTRNGYPAYYYSGYFSDGNKNYDVMVCFVDKGSRMEVVYKNVAYNVPPMNMAIVSDGEGELRLENSKNGFYLNLWENDEKGGLSGEAMQGSNNLSVTLSPTSSTF